jgi:uncharacterized protein
MKMRHVVATTTSAVVAGAAIGSAALLLGYRFMTELTKPGEVIAEDAPVWGGWHFPTNEPPSEEVRRSLSFRSADGTLLQGEFWAQPHPAPTIVLSHGFRLPRAQFRPVGALEYQHGCNILLFDYRGHGDSAQIATSGGNAEVGDLAAAVRLAAIQPETLPGNVFIHGFSMGAAVALLLPPMPQVAGIIADSPYAQLDEMLHRIVTWQLTSQIPHSMRSLRHLVPLSTTAALVSARMLFRMRYRHPLVARPERRLQRHGKSATAHHPPILLMHAQGDPLIPLSHAERIKEAARASGIAVETYYAPVNVHCGAYGYNPDAYIARLIGFVHGHEVG